MKKNVLITGATGDIGSQIAQIFTRKDYNLYIHGTNLQKLDKQAGELGAIPIQCDFANLNFDQIATLFPQNIDILINNAGFCGDSLLSNINKEDFDKTIDINLKIPMFLIKHMSPFMKKQKWGRIINISSLSAIKTIKGQSVYSATKAGLISASKVAALELAPYNITVNCIAPGLIESRMSAKIPKHRLEMLVNEIPQRRLGKPQDIARSCLFLIDSDYMTGQTIHINGGILMV